MLSILSVGFSDCSFLESAIINEHAISVVRPILGVFTSCKSLLVETLASCRNIGICAYKMDSTYAHTLAADHAQTPTDGSGGRASGFQ